MKKQFFTTKEVGKIIGVTNTTVANYCKNSTIKAEKGTIRTQQQKWIIKRENLLKYMEKHKITVPDDF